MQRQIIILSAIFLSFTLSAHEFYFAFAELEINPLTQNMEATLMVTGHDMEKALNEKGLIADEMETALQDSSVLESVENFINEHLILNGGSSRSDFDIVGYESFLNGQFYFYLLSDYNTQDNSFNIKFDLLMDTFGEQQNKITLYYMDRSYTLTFAQHETSRELKLATE